MLAMMGAAICLIHDIMDDSASWAALNLNLARYGFFLFMGAICGTLFPQPKYLQSALCSRHAVVAALKA